MKVHAQKRIDYGYDCVFSENGVVLGEILCGCDGIYCYWKTAAGASPAWLLKDIAKLLDIINAPYEKWLDEEFAKEESKL